jgi:hypothetical protein
VSRVPGGGRAPAELARPRSPLGKKPACNQFLWLWSLPGANFLIRTFPFDRANRVSSTHLEFPKYGIPGLLPLPLAKFLGRLSAAEIEREFGRYDFGNYHRAAQDLLVDGRDQ